MGHVSIELLVNYVTEHRSENDELQVVLSEPGYRSSKKAKIIVERLTGENSLKTKISIAPLFEWAG